MELDAFEPRTLNHRQDEGKDEKCRGSRCLELMTVCLWLICVLLLVIIILVFNQTINSFQDNYTDLTQKKLKLETRVNDLTVEKDQLKNSFNSLSQKKLELETRVKDLTVEKDQLKNSFNSLNQKKLELETRVKQTNSKRDNFFISRESKSWSESRKYCRDRGADLVIINTEEKQRFISSFAKEKVWIGLSDIETEGRMIWVDNSPLNRGFWSNGEPNNSGYEDCIELHPTKDPLNNWNDVPCYHKLKGICEKN